MDQNIFCSTLRGGNILITKFNHKLLKKLYEAYGEVDVEISDEEILNIEKEEEGSEVLDFEEESEESSPQTKSKKLKLPNPFQKK